jgi:two-component system heavy metal sensor histidine kinase CusS
MSSKNADALVAALTFPRTVGAWSLAARLTAWYSGSAFALILAATSFLYWASVRNLDHQDDQLLGDRVRVLQTVLPKTPDDTAEIHREVKEEWEAHQRTEIHVRILHEGGQIIAETPEISRLLPASSFPFPASEPGLGADTNAATGGLFRVLAVQARAGSQNSSPYIIQVAMDRSLEMQLRADYRKNLLLVLGVAFVVCAVVGYWIAHRGIRPIHDITDTARRIRPTNLDERMAPDGLPAELLTLAATFNQMLDRLERSFARLSQFSADIAHELRTPVYSMRGEMEVALGKPRSLEEYREVLGSSLEECGRLARLIDRMLFLARAENPETQITKEPCDLGVELATVCEFYGLAAAEAGVRLAADVHGKVLADLDRSLFQRAVGNLVANALAHTPRGGTVTLIAAGNDTSTRVEVVDTGSGIQADHLPHIFDRFYRADSTRSSKNGSVGLGLAIVRSIMELHGGSVDIVSEAGRGTRVILIFPRTSGTPTGSTLRPSARRSR